MVEATIYLSGLGFENGGLAAAHAINDGFAQEPQAHGMYHGEKVAFGTLAQLVLEKAPEAELEQVLSFLKDTGLPLTLAQLGVKENRARDLDEGGGGRLRTHPNPPKTCGPTSPPRRSTTPSWRPTAWAGAYLSR